MVLTIVAFLAWQGLKAYFAILSWIVTTWATVVWKVHWWYVKGMAYVLDRTSPQSPQLREPNGHKRRAIEMEEQIPETSRKQLAVTTPSLDYGRQKEATVSPGYVFSNSFKLAAFAACLDAVENLRRRDALIGVNDEELIQMICTIIRGGRDLYSVRIPWPMLGVNEGGEGRGIISGVNGVSSSHHSPPETTDWESIYSKYRPKSRGGAEGEGEKEKISDASKPRAKSPEYVDNLNKIHTSLASLHAIVEKTNAEKEELKKIQGSSSISSPSNSLICSKEEEKEGKKKEDEERSPREKKEEKEKIEKKRYEKETKEAGSSSKKNHSIDDLFDDGSENEEEIGVPPSAKRRKEETRQEKKMRKDEERRKKKGGEDEFLSSDEDEAERKEREKEKRREEREREKREAIMSISGCYSVKNNEKEEREREREKAREMERERARREAKEVEERERLKEKALEKERREEEKRKEEEKKKGEKEKSVSASSSVMPTRKIMKKCTCSLPFPDLDELNEKFDSEYRTLEECGRNWTDIKLHDIVATLRNGRWVRARVNETRADGLYLGLESSTGGGFSGRVKECTGCIHINKIVAIGKE